MRRCIGQLRRASSAVMPMQVQVQVPVPGSSWADEIEASRMQAASRRKEELENAKEGERDGERLLRAHSKSGLGSYTGPVTPAAVAYLLRKTRDPMQARAVFDWAARHPGFSGHNSDTSCALLTVYLKARLIPAAFSLFTRDLWRHCARSPEAYATMVRGYCYVGKMQHALALLRQMERLGFHIDTALHNALLAGLCKADRTEDAEEHFAKMLRNRDADRDSHSLLIAHLCRAGRLNRAVDVLYGIAGDGVAEVGMVNSVVEQLCDPEVARPGVAEELVEQMVEAGVLPDSTTFALLARGYLGVGLLNDGRRVLKQMVESGCAPDAATFAAAVEGLCRARRVEDARQTMEEMSRRGWQPGAATHGHLLAALCKLGRLPEVQRHLQRMIAAGVAPSAGSYEVVVKRMCKERQAMEAHRLLKEMAGRGCEPSPSVYNVLLGGQCRVSKASAAYGLFQQMVQRGMEPEAGHIAALVQLLHKNHRYVEANHVAAAIGT